MYPIIFNEVVLVLMSSRNATELGTTKMTPAVTELLDDNDATVTLASLSWQATAYPDTPDIVYIPLVFGIPPTYCAHDNHATVTPFPADVPGTTDTWPSHNTIREVFNYTHQHASRASVHNIDLHPAFNESN